MVGSARSPDCGGSPKNLAAHYQWVQDTIRGITPTTSPCPSSNLQMVLAYLMFPAAFFIMIALILPLLTAVVLQSFHELSDIGNGIVTTDSLDDFTTIWALMDSAVRFGLGLRDCYAATPRSESAYHSFSPRFFFALLDRVTSTFQCSKL